MTIYRNIEDDIISPIRLQDFLFSGISYRKCSIYYGNIIHVLKKKYLHLCYKSFEVYEMTVPKCTSH